MSKQTPPAPTASAVGPVQRQIIQKGDNPELLSLFVTNCYNEIHISVKFHKIFLMVMG